MQQKGFTLMELLIVIIIIGILATMAFVMLGSVRTQARDVKRVADIKTIHTALDLYYHDEGHYPIADAYLDDPVADPDGPDNLVDEFIVGQPLTSSTGITYLNKIPGNPTPTADGTCEEGNEYEYISTDGQSYSIKFCLGSDTGSAGAGINYSTAEDPMCTFNCTGKQCGDVCGQSCGSCGSGYGCLNYQCVDQIAIECTSSNGLGNWCGGGQLISTTNRIVKALEDCQDIGEAEYSCTYPTLSPYTSSPITIWDAYLTVTQNAWSTTDGRSNSCTGDSCLAFRYCEDMVYLGFDDWYLPAINELDIWWDNRGQGTPGIIQAGTRYFWSSTQVSVSQAQVIDIFNGVIANQNKNQNGFRARCFRRF